MSASRIRPTMDAWLKHVEAERIRFWGESAGPIAADPNGRLARRALAKEILLKLIEIAPTNLLGFESQEDGPILAWGIADEFLKAEGDAK